MSFAGRKHTPDSIEKMRAKKVGKKNAFAGRKHTPETIEKIKAKRVGKKSNFAGRKHTPESIEKMKARRASPETREKMSAASKRRMQTPEARQRVAEANRRRSPELLAQIGAKHRGKTISEAHRAANRAKLTGVPHTPQRRANIDAAKAARKAEREAATSQ